jgi:two-component system chemotaxis response regulator CheB
VSAGPLRILICEDSRTYAAGLRRLLEADPEIAVAAVASSAEEAIALLERVEPDLVTMDIELPGMNGVAAVEQIMASRPLPILVLSSHVGNGTELAAAALAAGALEALAKDALDLTQPAGMAAAALRERVKLLSRAHVIRHPRARLASRQAGAAHGRQAAAIGICASAGGPQALATVLAGLPVSFAVPVLVVQHIAAGFTEGLVSWLDGSVPPPVRIASQGTPVDGGGIWIAPDDHHLKLAPGGKLALDRTTVAGPHRPSGDVLLASLADVAGSAAVAVVLSGMGRDGTAGAHAVARAGGIVLAQDEASAAIASMPSAAAAASGAVRLPPGEIAARLAALEPLGVTR